MFGLTDTLLIPSRVIRDYQDILVFLQVAENRAQVCRPWVSRELFEAVDECAPMERRQIMNTQMKGCIAKGHAPLDRDWSNLHRSQQYDPCCPDVIMVC